MLKVNQLFDLANQVWRYNVTSNLIGQIKQLVNYNSLLGQWKRLYNWIQISTTWHGNGVIWLILYWNLTMLLNNIGPIELLTHSPLTVNFEDRWWPMQTIWIQMKPHKIFVWQLDYISAKYLGGNIGFLHLLKETNIWKNYPACKELIWMQTTFCTLGNLDL